MRIPLLLIAILSTSTLAQTAPVLQGAASRQHHGAAIYDIGLPLAGASGIEPRVINGALTVVLSFDKNVASGTATVTAGVANVASTSFSGNRMLINLANVAKAQSLTVRAANVTATGGGATATVAVGVRVLEGDVNASGTVSVADVNLAKYYVGQPVDASNFRADLNLSNSVSVADVNLAKFDVGSSVPGGPATNTAPVIGSIIDANTTVATATAALPVVIADAETPTYALGFRATSDNATLLPDSGIALGGAGNVRTVTLTPAARQVGTATVTLLASDGLLTATRTFTLTVTNASTAGSPQLFTTTLRPEGSSASAGSGSATLLLSADQTYATVRVAYSNLSTTKTGMHVHGPADPDGSGPIIFDMDSTPPEPDGSWKWVFTQSGNTTVADQIVALKAGRLYVNVHSSKYPAGELRGHFLSTTGSATFTPPAAPPPLPSGAPTQADAVRFLAQASYGASEATIQDVISQGYDAWVTNQFNTAQTRQQAILEARAASEVISYNQYWDAWWKLANTAPDQLRQRVAFAMSQHFVVAQHKSLLPQVPVAMAKYYDMLGRNGTGSFRQMLDDVTLSPIMGEWLDMRGNKKANPALGTNPNENYAREILQLFTIGLYQLHPDGTLKLGADGQPIPTYDQAVVVDLSRALTGWDYHQAGGLDLPPFDYMNPMSPATTGHDTGAKTLLNGYTIPAGQTIQQDMKLALDNIFNHPNVGPFVAKAMIQKLVCSNPSPGYVYRVAQKFDDNGSGVRGDMKAVFRAVLMDYEARHPDMLAQRGFGKLREPLLRTTAVMRALHAYSFYAPYNWSIDITDEPLGQTPMNAPTVFNFFEPGYVHPGVLAKAGLVAPEFQITTETTTITVANWFVQGIGFGFKYGDIKLNLNSEAAIAGNPAALVDRLNLLLCAGQMSTSAKTVIVNHLNTIPAGDTLTRARVAVYLVASSAQFAVQR